MNNPEGAKAFMLKKKPGDIFKDFIYTRYGAPLKVGDY